MIIEQIYTGCLAEAAYYIESSGEAAIIDPLREIGPYLKRAEKGNARISYIFETHFHADFVSGHIDLAEQSGATIVYGPTAETTFPAHIASDGEVFRIGELTITVLHTPGHTPESVTYLLKDEKGKPYCIFTGDTLFIGDVGRPDLAQQGKMTMEDMAGILYDSLHTKILGLPDEVIVYPAHGAGSACGKNISRETSDTLGRQKATNYALKAGSREQFIKEVTSGILPPPQYFAKNAAMNKNGYERFAKIIEKGTKALDPDDFEQLAVVTGALVLDTRTSHDFAAGFIPGAINIGLDGQFAPWVGALVSEMEQPLLLLTEPGREEEAVMRLSRVGYDHTIGYLKGGFAAWTLAGKQTDSIFSVSAEEFMRVPAGGAEVLDVRKPDEYEDGHLKEALLRPLDYINDWTNELTGTPEKIYYVHCAGGYRSMIAASILKARGVDKVINIEGGYTALKAVKI
ncbi:MBL fold metallo-hydrolase [Pedobacter sp. JY14-1]|uniref:MBL fold metallo-hydrolase n=1 Tax=Pedobacter sp. JY14-1 TaxID=3034151 RepID=UPI0023E2242C|nr:MBL fold metallo-hydrolase [Pedobacter sp. JY14-1]